MTPGGGMDDENLIGQGGDKFISPGGQIGSDAVLPGGERRQDQQAAGGQGLLPFWGDSPGQRACRTNDYGLCAAQQDLQAFLFHGRMESADDAPTSVAPLGGLVVRCQDDLARTAGGAEKRGFGKGEQVEVAED